MRLEEKFIFYLQFIISTLMSFVLMGLMLVYFSVPDFGIFTMYSTLLGYYTIFSLGIQDSMKINYRTFENIEINSFEFNKLFKLLYIVQLVPVCVLLIYSIFLQDILLIFVSMSIIPNNIMIASREIYLSTGRLLKINIIDIIFKSFQLISLGLCILFSVGIYIYLLLNLIIRIFLVIYLEYYNKNSIMKEMYHKKTKVDYVYHIKTGFLIIIGVWLLGLSINLDVFFASSNDPIVLGEYSIYKTIANTSLMLLVPMRSLLFISFSSKISKNQVSKIANKMLKWIFAVIICMNLLLQIINMYIDIPDLYILLIYLLTVPMYSIFSILIVNYLLIKGRKNLIIFSIFSVLIFVIIFTLIGSDSLLQIVFAQICSLFIVVSGFMLHVTSYRITFKFINLAGLFTIIYLYSIYSFLGVFMSVILVIVVIIEMYNELFKKRRSIVTV